MNKLFKIALVVLSAVALFVAYRYVSAQEEQSRRDGSGAAPAPTVRVEIPNVLATKHILQGAYINSGALPGTAIPANTYTPVDSQLTVSCPGTAGTCTIEADMLVQNGQNTAPDNNNRVCLYVDGTPGPNCLFLAGQTPTDNFAINAVQADTVTGVLHGNHTVQMYFWTRDGASVAHYQATYRVYKP